MMENCGGEDVVNLLLDKCAAICEICSEDSGTDYVKFNLKKKGVRFCEICFCKSYVYWAVHHIGS